MKYETVEDLTLPKIGFGAYRIGGSTAANPSLDGKSLNALRTALEAGYTHYDTAEIYAAGRSEELVGRAVRESGKMREDLFITSKVHPNHLRYGDVLTACENSLQRLGTEYLDLYLIHWPRAGMNLEEAFRALNKLVRDGRVKHLGVSNFDLRLLKRSQSLSETPILTNQVHYSLAHRNYAENGTLEYCRQNDILLTAHTPLEEGSLRANKALKSIAQMYGATTFQIALAWLISQPRVITIPMSFNPRHIRENFDAADIELTPNEIERLTEG
jgi:diketogulonate reductase-like aldo/keto reductase